ncbi:MAG: transcription termination/antitermination protein NusA, partial [Aeriscardovia sp.]|nr:transcription termination/antitermination protein NusA [Aeriscardovia sp.]
MSISLEVPDIRELAHEEGIKEDELKAVLETSLLQAYCKFPDALPIARAEIDSKRGTLTMTIWGKKEEDGPEIDCTPKDFSRQSTKIVRSALRQLVRHTEDEKLFGSFLNRKGKLITGVVQQDKGDGENIHVAVGETEALLPKREQTPGEKYSHG